jgi:hypothetical protein
LPRIIIEKHFSHVISDFGRADSVKENEMIGINDIIPIFDIGTRVIEKGSNNPKGLYINGRYNDKYETFYKKSERKPISFS